MIAVNTNRRPIREADTKHRQYPSGEHPGDLDWSPVRSKYLVTNLDVFDETPTFRAEHFRPMWVPFADAHVVTEERSSTLSDEINTGVLNVSQSESASLREQIPGFPVGSKIGCQNPSRVGVS